MVGDCGTRLKSQAKKSQERLIARSCATSKRGGGARGRYPLDLEELVLCKGLHTFVKGCLGNKAIERKKKGGGNAFNSEP